MLDRLNRVNVSNTEKVERIRKIVPITISDQEKIDNKKLSDSPTINLTRVFTDVYDSTGQIKYSTGGLLGKA
jgi:hypothetical protein